MTYLFRLMKLPAYLTGFSSRVDGSAGIRFTTNELTADDFGLLQNNLNKFGWLVFQENEAQLVDMPIEQAEDKNKTPSKRLRAVLFILWTQTGKPGGDFEVYYRNQVEKIIDHLKSKLD